ncbi:MAG TPA: hypothetical protein VGB24_14715 [Longimicrobium sp.]|jgi:uncharacterized protein YbaR (Trm112 family)|uniref:hypothetical protein n=1 Tax=Longimicrobium sp. TaxID=2029185 RepID=UPI002EDB67AC
MYILLTDALTCPRCGPGFGLLVQADRLEERRVVEGRLGCANCRETYAIGGGVAHLSLGSATGADVPADPPADDPEAPVKLAALMGLAGARGLVMLEGPGGRHAAALATLVPEVEVVAVGAGSATPPAMEPGVSRVRAGAALPFRDGAMRGAALTSGAGDDRLREALRVLAPGARLLVDPADAETAARLRGLGAQVMLEQEDVVVAAAPGRPVQLGPSRRG